MIGLIIATHAALATELLNAAESIVGPISHVRCLSVSADDDLESMQQRLQEDIAAVDCCDDGVLIMTDLFGGTPANIAARFLSSNRVEIVNGVNLPILLKFSSSRDSMDLPKLATFMRNYGQKSIVLTSDILCGVES
ncbi:MAG: PTS sugar transporter subunit IIA [Desulfuromonas sp.]|nr:PTS sugar transporter subunit IIA [Desulfuromonas sp.]